MAVRFDTLGLRSLVGEASFAAAERLYTDGLVETLDEVGGGVRGTVNDGGRRWNAWVGIVDQSLVGECDCPGPDGQDLCTHTIAVAIAGLGAHLRWSGSAQPPSAMLDEAERQLAEAAAALTHEQLLDLVVDYAGTDRVFATLLLTRAGVLGQPASDEIDAFRDALDEVAAVPHRANWRPEDLVAAGRWMLDELDVLAARPAGEELMLAVEESIEVWDSLTAHLHGTRDDRAGDPTEIGRPLAEIHRRLCEELRPTPAELAKRLNAITAKAPYGSCLELVDYSHLLDEADPNHW